MSQEANPSRIVFPLHSSVELFQDRRALAPASRVKQAAVLYDAVAVEAGMLEVTISDTFSNNWWHPPQNLTKKRRAELRGHGAPGERVTLAFGAQEGPGKPAEEMQIVMEGPIAERYTAEFHTGILDELLPLEPDWLEVLEIGGGSLPGHLGKAQSKLNFSDMGVQELLPDLGTFHRDYVRKGFNRDLLVAEELGAALGVTPLFEPMPKVPTSRPGERWNGPNPCCAGPRRCAMGTNT